MKIFNLSESICLDSEWVCEEPHRRQLRPIFLSSVSCEHRSARARRNLLLSWIVLCMCTFSLASPCHISASQVRFTSSHGQVSVDLFTPVESGPRPLIVMIHGSAGIFTIAPGIQSYEENFGEVRLAGDCFIVVMPHYMDVINVKSLTDLKELQENFTLFLSTLLELMPRFRSLPNVDSSRIGLYGESYGGFLAAALATSDSTIAAVSEYSGGIPQGYRFVTKPPPFLIQHGQDDTLVPVSEAYGLKRAVEAAGGWASIITFPANGHYFDKKSRAALLGNSVQFFEKQLDARSP